MASYQAHVSVAAVSGLGIGLLSLQIPGVELTHSVVFAICGLLGGILPDIDSDHSTAIKIIFTILALILASLLFIRYQSILSLPSLVALSITAYVFIRYILKSLFAKLTVHRGIFHSIVAAMIAGLATASIGIHWLHLSELIAWLTGFAISLGYITHLTLDELYSVDLNRQIIKKSFGTALKLLSLKYPYTSIIAMIIIVTLINTTPGADVFLQAIFQKT